MTKNDYYTRNAKFHEWIKVEIVEAPISRALLIWKAGEMFGFNAKAVNKAIDKLIAIGAVKEDTPGIVEAKRRADA